MSVNNFSKKITRLLYIGKQAGKIKYCIIAILLLFTQMTYAQVTLSGALTGNYTRLALALNAINVAGGAGNVTVTVTANTTETTTALLNQTAYTVTITANSSVVVTCASNIPVINLNGADNVTIDGTIAKNLTIRSTSIGTAGAAINLSNNADNNLIKNCILEGSTKGQFNNGVVNVKGGSASSGCDFNTFDKNTIKEAGVNLPQNSMTFEGATFGVNTFPNIGNLVSNNNIINFFNPTGFSVGIYSYRYNSGMQIFANSFYQTATRTATLATSQTNRPIEIDDNFYGGNMGKVYITSNYIGGNSAQAAGTPYTINSTVGLASMIGIFIAGTVKDTNVIRFNTIKNISISSVFNQNSSWINFYGIFATQGKVDIAYNSIGSSTVNNSITLNATMASTSVFSSCAIMNHSISSANIYENTIGGISVNPTFASGTPTYKKWGIYALGTDSCKINNNSIGSNFGSNVGAIQVNTTPNVQVQLWGIGAENSNVTITENYINNLQNTGSYETIGIGLWNSVAGKTYNCTDNLIHNLKTTTGNNLSIAGIAAIAVSGTAIDFKANIKANWIDKLSNTSTTGLVNMFGIWLTRNASSVDCSISGSIEDNYIENINSSGTDLNSIVAGIFDSQGHNQGIIVKNNTIAGITAKVGNMTGISVQTNLPAKAASGIATIEGNDISGINCNYTGGGVAHSGLDVDVKNGIINKNKVYNINAPNVTGTSTIAGIQLYFTGPQTMVARNNMVSISSFGENTVPMYGISVQNPNNVPFAQTLASIDYNTIFVGGFPTDYNINAPTAAFGLLSLTAILSLKNNILYNGRDGNYSYSIYNATNTWFPTASDYNYMVAPNDYNLNYTSGAAYDFTDWKTYFSDAHSISRTLYYNPFTDPSELFNDYYNGDLGININNPYEASFLQNKAIPIGAITADINGVTRNTVTPDIGAYEFATVPATLSLKAKVFLNHVDTTSGLMDNYFATNAALTNFPLSDPYATAPLNTKFTHVNNPTLAATTNAVLAVTGNDAIVDWVFLELRAGISGTSTVEYTRAALLQRDGDIVDMDGFSPVAFTSTPWGLYYVTVRHHNHLGFRTASLQGLIKPSSLFNLTDSSISMYGISPRYVVSSTKFAMIPGDSNFDGSIDGVDSTIWQLQNGGFDDYTLNTDYNLDGSVDATDSALWELNNGKYEELD